jgi:two-component system NtrC family sensor kinase
MLYRTILLMGITVKTGVPQDIYCRLPNSGFRHVLLNLVVNAAQAIGENPGTIDITAARNDGQVEFAVSDDGPGFPQELLTADVYEYGTWRKGGTGIGLVTARRFALAHGSRLELRQAERGATTVALILPVDDGD